MYTSDETHEFKGSKKDMNNSVPFWVSGKPAGQTKSAHMDQQCSRVMLFLRLCALSCDPSLISA